MRTWSGGWVKIEGITDWIQIKQASSGEVLFEVETISDVLPVLSLELGQDYRLLVKRQDEFGERIWDMRKTTLVGYSSEFDGSDPVTIRTSWKYNYQDVEVTGDPPLRYQAMAADTMATARTAATTAAERKRDQDSINWKSVGF